MNLLGFLRCWSYISKTSLRVSRSNLPQQLLTGRQRTSLSISRPPVRFMSTRATGYRAIFLGSEQMPKFVEESAGLPPLEEGQVLVKVRAATICPSDIHTVTGLRKEPTPSVLGHEAVVEVVESRRRDSALRVGDRCTFSIADSCGSCTPCVSELPQKCKSLFKYGHSHVSIGGGFTGSYASHIVIRRGTHIVLLPDEITDRMGAPLNCAMATMVNCVSHLSNKHFESAIVQGDGLLGLYGCALLREMGFSKVYCQGKRRNRFPLVTKFGGIPMEASEPIPNEENNIDVVIEVCGSPDALTTGMRYLRPGGTYIIAGMVHPRSELKVTGEQLIRKCATLIGVHNYSPNHLDAAVRFMATTRNKYPYEEVVGQTFPLHEIEAAMCTASEKIHHRVCVMP